MTGSRFLEIVNGFCFVVDFLLLPQLTETQQNRMHSCVNFNLP